MDELHWFSGLCPALVRVGVAGFSLPACNALIRVWEHPGMVSMQGDAYLQQSDCKHFQNVTCDEPISVRLNLEVA